MATFRPARESDVAAICALLADDELGAQRENLDNTEPYLSAFRAIQSDPHHYLMVAELGGEVVGTLQLTIIPSLARSGATRGQLEAVRIHRNQRSKGLGEQMFRAAFIEAQPRGAVLVQLTTDAHRPDAHRFYEKLGFQASHIGYKLELTPDDQSSAATSSSCERI